MVYVVHTIGCYKMFFWHILWIFMLSRGFPGTVASWSACISWTFQNNTLKLNCSADTRIDKLKLKKPSGETVATCTNKIYKLDCEYDKQIASVKVSESIWEQHVTEVEFTVNYDDQIKGQWTCDVWDYTNNFGSDKVNVVVYQDTTVPVVQLEAPKYAGYYQEFMLVCSTSESTVGLTAILVENGNMSTKLTRAKHGCFSHEQRSICTETDECHCSEDGNFYVFVRSIAVTNYSYSSFKCLVEFENSGQVASNCRHVYIGSNSISLNVTNADCSNSIPVNISCTVHDSSYYDIPHYGFLPWKHRVNEQFVRYLTGNVTGNVSRISLDTCNLADYGEYICRISTSVPDYITGVYTLSKKGTIFGKGSPKCISATKYLTGNSILLNCNVYSVPPLLSIRWSKSNVHIEPSAKVHLSHANNRIAMYSYGVLVYVDGYSANLTINNINHQDSGNFTAVVKNAIGQCNCSFHPYKNTVPHPSLSSTEQGFETTDWILHFIVVPLASLVVILLSLTIAMATYIKRRFSITISGNNTETQEMTTYHLTNQYESIAESAMIQGTLPRVNNPNIGSRIQDIMSNTEMETLGRTLTMFQVNINNKLQGGSETSQSRELVENLTRNNADLTSHTSEYLSPCSALQGLNTDSHKTATVLNEITSLNQAVKSNGASQMSQLQGHVNIPPIYENLKL